MAKKAMTAAAKAKKSAINTARRPGETAKAWKQRMRRNQRVRERRKKARAVKRAGKATATAGTAAPQAEGVHTTLGDKRAFSVIVAKDSITGYLDGIHSFALTGMRDEDIAPVVDAVALIVDSFGGQFAVTDLRKR